MVEFDILFNEGINQLGELLDMGTEKGILRRSGTWLSYGDVRLGQGRERAREFLRDHTEVQEKLRQEVLGAYGVLPAGAGAEAEPTAAEPAPDQPPRGDQETEANPALQRAARPTRKGGNARSGSPRPASGAAVGDGSS